MSSTLPVEYTDAQQVIKLLALKQDSTDSNKYIVWAIPISLDVINQFVKYGNEQTTALWGNLTNSPSLGLARQYATWRAVLNLIETMTLQWTVSGMPVTVGDISIQRLQAMQAASAEFKARAEIEVWRIYVLLSDMAFPQNYQSPSPYIQTGGGMFWS